MPQHHHAPGLEPEATPAEIEAAARQYVRKISGVQKTSAHTEEAFEKAVAAITEISTDLLASLPPRQRPRPPCLRSAASPPGPPDPAPDRLGSGSVDDR